MEAFGKKIGNVGKGVGKFGLNVGKGVGKFGLNVGKGVGKGLKTVLVKSTDNKVGRNVRKVGLGVGMGIKTVINKSKDTISKPFRSNSETGNERDLLDIFADDMFEINKVVTLDSIKQKYLKTLEKDDNRRIVNNILERLEKGATEYKHGMRVNDDTRMYGTKDNSWLEMALEEYLDGILYITSSLIRHKRRMKLENFCNKSDKIRSLPFNDK